MSLFKGSLQDYFTFTKTSEQKPDKSSYNQSNSNKSTISFELVLFVKLK